MSQPASRAVPPHMLRNPSKNSNIKSKSQPASRSSSRRPAPVQSPSTASSIGDNNDAASSQATGALIRRVLCPPSASAGLSSPRPWQEQLPALTSSREIDEQLYAILAVVIRDFVLAWYSKITPDHQFVTEVISIIAHCTTQLETRACCVDWVEVLLHDVPSLVAKHIDSLKIATSHQSSFVSQCQAYHTLNTHPAFSPAPDHADIQATVEDQARNEAAYRQLLVQSMLAILLPKDDLQNPTLRILVADVIADLMLGNVVSGRLCEGWFVWDSVIKVTLSLRARRGEPADQQADHDDTQDEEKSTIDARSALERSGLLETSSDRRDGADSSGRAMTKTKLPRALRRLLVAANLVFAGLTMLIAFAKNLYAATLLPPRAQQLGATVAAEPESGPFLMRQRGLSSGASPPLPAYQIDGSGRASQEATRSGPDREAAPVTLAAQAPAAANDSESQSKAADEGRRPAKKRPILMYAIYSMASKAVALGERMPWLIGLLALMRQLLVFGPVLSRAADTDGPLDKYLHHQAANFLTPSQLPATLRIIRAALFPNNAMPPPRVVPTEIQKLELKATAIDGMIELIPPRALKLYYGDELRARQYVEEMLDVFGNAYCNKHLVFGIIELLLVRLLPEMTVKSVDELMSERLEGV